MSAQVVKLAKLLKEVRNGLTQVRYSVNRIIYKEDIRVKIKKLLMLVGVLGVVLLLAIPLVTSCAAPEPETGVLKIGALGSLTGDTADWGVAIEAGLIHWQEDVNAKGGITVGGKTYMIEVISYDDKADTSVMLDALNKLVYEDGVTIVLPLFIGSNAYASFPIVDENNILIIGSNYGFDDVLSADHPMYFRNFSNPHERNPAILQWVSENLPDVKTILNVVTDDEAGVSVDQIQRELGPSYGFEMLPTEYIEWGIVDVTPVMSRVVAQNPDLIHYGNIDLTTMPLMIKAARELGYTGRMGTDCGSLRDDVFVPAAGGAENVEGFYAPVFAAHGPGAKFVPAAFQAYAARYIEDYGFFDDWGADNYMSLQILEQAIYRADSIDTVKIAAELEGGKDFEVLIGKTYFGGKAYYGRAGQLMNPLPIAIYKNGYLETVAVLTLEDWS